MQSEARRQAQGQNRPLSWPAAALGAHAVAAVLLQLEMVRDLQWIVQVSQIALVVVMAIGMRGVSRPVAARLWGDYRGVIAAAALLILLVSGWSVTQWLDRTADQRSRRRILTQVTGIAGTISPEQVKALSFTADDKSNPSFRRLRQQMIAFGEGIRQRCIYSIALRDSRIVFGPENIPEQDKLASPPGTVYERPTPANWEILRTGHPYSEGPYTDEYGTFVSAFAPVYDARTGQVLMAVGLDVLANDWRREIASHRLVAIAFTLMLALIVLLAMIQPSSLLRSQPSVRWLPTGALIVAGAIGLVLTAGGALLARYVEADGRRLTFEQVAEGLARDVIEVLEGMRDRDLAGLARFFEASRDVTSREFALYAGPMAKGGAVQAFEWVPQVLAAEKEQAEALVRSEGQMQFTIFQRDAAGNAVPAVGREVYYPVVYVQPLSGNERALGFDLGSESLRRAAIEESLSTGLPTATAPLVLVQDPTKQQSTLLLCPVFAPASLTTAAAQDQTRTIRGLVLAVMRLQSTLNEALAQADPDELMGSVELLQLRSGASPQWLASWPEQLNGEHAAAVLAQAGNGSGLSTVYPLFVFGQTYGIVVHPGPAFLVAYPARAGWLAVVVGLMLTSGAMGLVGVIGYRRAILQHEVETNATALTATRKSRESALREEARVKALLRLSQMTHLTQDQIVEYASEAATRITASEVGYIAFVNEDETVLTTIHWSRTALEQCAISDRPLSYAVTDTGLWGEAVRQRRPIITNDYQAPNAQKKGTPPGHLPIQRHMNVPVFDGGRIVLIAGVGNKAADYTSEDVTQLTLLMDGMWKIICRRQAEESLRDSEERHRILFESSRDAIMVIAPPDPHFVSGNRAALELFGAQDHSQLVARDPADFSPPHQADGQPSAVKAERMIETAMREGSHHFEWTHRRLDGRDFDATVSLTRMSIDGRSVLQATVRDITEQKRAAATLQLQSSALQAAANAIVITDLAGNITWVNSAFTQLTGYPFEEVAGRNPRLAKSGMHDESFYRGLWDTIVAGQVWHGEITNRRKDGTLYTEDMTITPVLDEASKISHFIAIKQDITNRKRAAQELAMKTTLLEAQAETSPDGILAVDDRGMVILSNRRFGELWDLPTELLQQGRDAEMLANSLSKVKDPDAFVAKVREIYASADRKTRDEIEFKNGQLLERHSSPLTDAAGTHHGRIWYFRDITERKRVEQALKESLEDVSKLSMQQQLLLTHGNDIVYRQDAQGMFTYLSPSVERVTGHTPAEWTKHYTELLTDSPMNRAVVENTERALQTGEQSASYQAEVFHKDGRRIVLEVSETPYFEDGRIGGIIGVARDVTARKEAEQALTERARHQLEVNRLQEDLLGPGELADKLTKITALGVRVFELDFCRIWITRPGDLCRSGCVHAGALDESHLCRNRERCLHLMASSGRYTHIDGKAHRRIPFGSYKIGLLASGQSHAVVSNDVANDPAILDHEWAKELGLVAFAGYQLRPPGGQTMGVMAMFARQAITPEKNAMLENLANVASQVIQSAAAEEEQRSLQRQLTQAQRLESVGQLAAGIAHEINTPTQFVSDNTRFLQNAFPKFQDLLTRYRRLLDACRRGPIPLTILDEVEAAAGQARLDYLMEQVPEAIADSLEGLERVTKIVHAMKDFAHPGQQSMSAADLNNAIQSTVTVTRNEWKYVADLKLELDPELPQVPCMLAEFNQVILNIVVNAAHAIADAVGEGGQEKGTITICTRRVAGEVEIRISDTGTGIPEQCRDRIFDPFFTTKEPGKGTGQGLMIARRVIVEKHHGTLDFETETGRGTTFIIRLPIEPGPTDAAGRTEDDDASAAN